MSSYSSTTISSSTSSPSPVELPGSDYRVYVWKVKFGSVVRKGETVAVAVLLSGADAKSGGGGGDDDDASTKAGPSHKRPQRRKKLMAPPSSSTGSSATSTSASSQPGGTSVKPKRLLSALTAGVRSTEAAMDKTSFNSSMKRKTVDSDTNINGKKASASKSASESVGPVPVKANSDGILKKTEQIREHDEKNALIIAYVLPCQHPAVLDGMCVVCGVVVGEKDSSSSDHSSPGEQSSLGGASATASKSQVTVSGGVTMTVSNNERRDMSYQVQQRLWKQKKLNLVLDLDHTLVHATPDRRAHDYYSGNPRASEENDERNKGGSSSAGAASSPSGKKQSDVYALSLQIPDAVPKNASAPKLSYHFVKIRPHVAAFFNEVKSMYEFSVYTAGTREYAVEVVDMLCRHVVGAKHDGPILAELRIQAANAAKIYESVKRRNERKRALEKANTAVAEDKSEDLPSKKKAKFCDENGADDVKSTRRKVGFAETVSTNDNESANLKEDNSDTNKDKKKSAIDPPVQMTLEELTAIQNKLKSSEEMETKAMELRQQLFGSRIVSRTDVGDLGRDVKSLARVFPGGGSMAAVVDDREDVWANSSANGDPPANLLLVRPYHFTPFAGFADVNNAAGADLSKTGNGESSEGSSKNKNEDSEKDQQLLWTSKTLKELHRRYYLPKSRINRDTVPEILAKMRRHVLKGCKIVLSGIVPLHLQQRHSEQDVGPGGVPLRKRAPMIRYLETLGANLVDSVRPSDTTHVVAANAGTAKAQAAVRSGTVALVKPSWLMECYWSVSKRSIRGHLFSDSHYVPETLTSNQSSSDSDDEMDDDFASQLENELL